MERLLGGEVYHYHHKLILKEPLTGGAWEWHQDYGYWYNNGCLFPLLASCLIAIDRATGENGCLEVLQGSHLIGRIDHGKVGDQTGADLERVEAALRAAAAGPLRAGARLGHFLPLQSAPLIGPEPQPQPALGPDLLLQRRPQRPLQGLAPPALHAAGKMARRAACWKPAAVSGIRFNPLSLWQIARMSERDSRKANRGDAPTVH